VLDASVVLKWWIEEEDSDKAIWILNRYKEEMLEIAAPDLLIYEIANVLRYNLRFTTDEIRECIKDLLELELDIIAPVEIVIDLAVETARQREISFYDGLYVTMAQGLGFQLITADEKLYQKVRDLPFVNLLKKLEIR
jgi:predicted nucleic acid-binding protein